MQAFSILNWMIMVGLTNSQISPFHNTPPITMANVLQVVNVKMERFWHLVCINLTSFEFFFS
jgi:hypothetical protein